MDVRNCSSCGKMFTYLSGPPLCQACLKKMDDKFAEVKQYVYDHPGCHIQDVCDDMDVTQQQVKKWIREERLTFADSSDIALTCEKCGKRILTGRFCKECKESMINQMNGLYKKEEPQVTIEKHKTENKMRFIKE